MIRFKETPPGGEPAKPKPAKPAPQPAATAEELPLGDATPDDAPKGKVKKGFGRKKPMGR